MSDILEQEKKVDLEKLAYEQMKMAILEGVYPPGCQIAEEMIAGQLSMSRSPVRMAIKQLEAEGFLEKRSNRRMYVTLADSKRTLDSLYVRKALEGIAAYQAALNRTDENIANIQHLLNEMRQWRDCGDSFRLYQMSVDVHRLFYVAANNPQLERIGLNAIDQEAVFSYRSLTLDKDRIIDAYSEHEAIAAAIIAQDADLAESRAREHIDQLIKRVKDNSKGHVVNRSLLLGFSSR